MRSAAFAIAALLSLGPAAAAPRDAQLCADAKTEASVRISSCTRLIEEKPAANTLILRAQAYQSAATSQPDTYDKSRAFALIDLNRAVALEPKNPAAYLARATFYEWDFNWKCVFEDLDRAIALSPTTEALQRRGDVRAALGNHKGAIADYTIILARLPLDPPILLKRAYQRWQARDDSGARDDYDRAVEASPQSPIAHVKRGEFLAAQLRTSQALRDFEKAISLQPDFAPAYAARGKLRAGHREYKQAVGDLSQALKRDPGDIESRRTRAQAYFALNESDRALADISKVVAAEEGVDDALLRAMIYIQKGGDALALAEADASKTLRQLRNQMRWDTFRDFCKLLCRVRDPLTLAAHLLRKGLSPNAGKSELTRWYEDQRRRTIADAEALIGTVTLKRGNGTLAGALFEKALRYSTDGAIAYFGRAVLRQQTGDLDGAKDDIAAARNNNPDVPEHFAHMGFDRMPRWKTVYVEPPAEGGLERDVALCAGGELNARPDGSIDFAPTIDACTRAIRAGGTPIVKAQAYANRGQWSEMSGKRDTASTDRQAALSLDPNNVQALMARAGDYAMQRQTAKALADYDKVIKIDPKAFLAWFGRCDALADARDMKAAVAACDRAVEVAGDADYVVTRRALVLLRAGQYARAQQDYNAYLRELPRRGQPADPYALFGRGIARKYLGDSAGAVADFKAARALDKNVEREYAALGLKP